MHKQNTVLSKLVAIAAFGLTLSATGLVHAQADVKPAKKEWTMLVFVNGHNNLDSFGAYNINQMETVGSTSKLNVVVQWASLAAKTTKRLLVQKDNDISKVTSPVVEEMPPVDMGDKNNLLDFIKWGADHYPAKHYMVVVWDHGSGWHFRNGGFGARDISLDEKTGHIIRTEELGQVMKSASAYLGQKIDIYGSDACLMSMIEVAQEMAGSVNTFVGSQELEPGDGWPYDRFLQAWTANPAASSNDVGRMLVDAYFSYYTDKKEGNITFSALDMRKLPALLTTMKELHTKLAAVNDQKAMQAAATKATRFYYDDYVDIGELVNSVKTELNKTGEAQAELERTSILLNSVVLSSKNITLKANGLSVWWPTSAYQWSAYKARYSGLSFAKETGWAEMFEHMF